MSLPLHLLVSTARRTVSLPLNVATYGVTRAFGLVQRFGTKAVEEVQETAETVVDASATAVSTAKIKQEGRSLPSEQGDVYPSEGSVEVAVDEFGAVGSLTDNTGVEPDGSKQPFPGYDKLSGDRVMAHVAESTDLPDLQVLLSYEEAHKNRKGVVEAVEARLAELGAPIS